MPKFKIEFQVNDRGVMEITAPTREEAEAIARDRISDGYYYKWVIRSDTFVEAL